MRIEGDLEPHRSPRSGARFPGRTIAESPERVVASAAAPSGFLSVSTASPRVGTDMTHESLSPRKQIWIPACAPPRDGLPFPPRRWGNPQTYRIGGKPPMRTRPSNAVRRRRGHRNAHRLRSAGFRTDRTGRTGILRDRRANGSVAGFRACCSRKRERGFRAAPAVGFGRRPPLGVGSPARRRRET